jgi:hypothetical protein
VGVVHGARRAAHDGARVVRGGATWCSGSGLLVQGVERCALSGLGALRGEGEGEGRGPFAVLRNVQLQLQGTQDTRHKPEATRHLPKKEPRAPSKSQERPSRGRVEGIFHFFEQPSIQQHRLIRRSAVHEIHNVLVILGKHNGLFLCV